MQGYLTVLNGKQIAPQLPKVVGAWLTGTFDGDKSVSRAAVEAFQKAFPSEDKRKAVWKLYQGPLIDYVKDAVLSHSPHTLSDERTTSPDEAEAKYVRVISAALLVLDQFLQTDSAEKALSSNKQLRAVISAKKAWELASHIHPSVRRAFYKLVTNVIGNGTQLDGKLLSSCFLAKSLHISQSGSSSQHISALIAITKSVPSVWTSDYASEIAVSRRLRQYLKLGSQKGPEAWWLQLRQFIRSIPIQAWSDDASDYIDRLPYNAAGHLLDALHEGVTNNDEPRQNVVAAWSTFVDLFSIRSVFFEMRTWMGSLSF